MVKGIKGITIEIDGDTSGLSQALKAVDKDTKSVQSELKEVDRLLKFDPSNVELLAQKQKLLGDAVDNTSKRMDILRQAQGEVERQFQNGEIGEEAYRKFQREIIATEGMLKAFQRQAESTQIRIDAQADTSQVDKMKNALKELGPAAKQAGKEIADGIKVGAAGATAAVGALVLGSGELNQDLARLRTNAQIAGHDLGLVEDAFKQVTAVTGEADSAVETVSNLLASGFKDVQLQGVIEGINGAAIKFSDTLKTEGIADGIQETFATGEAIGMFAELLERSGVDLEEFNAKLADAKKKGEEADLVMQTMSELGLTQVSQKYKEMNPEITENAEATLNMQMALADLAIILTPLVTMITNFITKIVEWVRENETLAIIIAVVAGAITGISAVISMLMPIVNAIIALWPVLAGVFGTITAPVAIVVAAIAGLIAVGIALWKNWEEVSAWLSELWTTIKTNAFNAFTQIKDVIVNTWNESVAFTKDLWTVIKDFIVQAWNFVLSILSKTNIVFIVIKHWDDISKQTAIIWDNIKKFISDAWETIKDSVSKAVTNVVKVIRDKFTEMYTTISEIMEIVRLFLYESWELIKTSMTEVVTTIINIIREKFTSMQTTLSNIMNAIGKFLSDTWQSIKTTISMIVTNIFNTIRDKFTEAHQFIVTIMNTVKIFISDAWETIKLSTGTVLSTIVSTVTEKFNALKKAVTDKMNEAKKTITDIWDQILDFFDGVSLFGVGEDIMKGLINGIKSMASGVVDAIKNTVQAAIDKAKDLLDINSPSRVFFQIGEWTNKGFMDGINATRNKLSDTMGNVYGSLSSSAQKSIEQNGAASPSTSSTDNSRHFNPTIHITTVEDPSRAAERMLKRIAYQM